MPSKKPLFDRERVKKLASMGLTVEEIAAVEECSKRTLERHAMDDLNTGRHMMSASVKRKQYEVGVINGDKTMLIWLGKQHCGQRDNVDSTIDHTHRYYVEGPPAAEDGKSWQEQYSPATKNPTMQ